jgi:hypothetical protein
MSGSISALSSCSGSSCSSSAAATTSAAQDKLVLSRLLQSYQVAVNKGQSAASLKSLAQQIDDAARQVGRTVDLPVAAVGLAALTVPSAAAASTGGSSRVNLVA